MHAIPTNQLKQEKEELRAQMALGQHANWRSHYIPNQMTLKPTWSWTTKAPLLDRESSLQVDNKLFVSSSWILLEPRSSRMRQVVRKNQVDESNYVLTKDLTELLKTE